MNLITHLAKAAVFFLLMATCQRTQAGTTNSPSISNNAETAWKELQQAAMFPKKPLSWDVQRPTSEQKEKFHKKIVDEAAIAANQARAFYICFPGSINVIPAKILECQMFERIFNNSGATQESVEMWGKAQDTLLADARLVGEERCALRLAILHRKQFDRRLDQDLFQVEYEKNLRELIKDCPQSDQSYEELLKLAANASPEKARSIINEILSLPISETNRAIAGGILRRLDAVGKPLDMKFTAVDGRPVDLSRMKGKVVLLDFWATWCVPCVGEIPQIENAYKKFHDQGFEVIGISFDTIQPDLQHFLDQKKLPWPQYFDGKDFFENKFGKEYGIHAIPQTWLVDKNGNLREINGQIDLESKVEKLLAE